MGGGLRRGSVNGFAARVHAPVPCGTGPRDRQPAGTRLGGGGEPSLEPPAGAGPGAGPVSPFPGAQPGPAPLPPPGLAETTPPTTPPPPPWNGGFKIR